MAREHNGHHNGGNGTAAAVGLMQKAMFAAVSLMAPLLVGGFIYMMNAHSSQAEQISGLDSRMAAMEKSEVLIRDELKEEITRLRDDIDELEHLLNLLVYQKYERPLVGEDN